ncbi:MAG: hypothetical protein B7733_17510 [Myxococcales bacterium FL481]|nr:MAG: hypothetical protein B7733_17510 [Myxococcales bacterium FL481]
MTLFVSPRSHHPAWPSRLPATALVALLSSGLACADHDDDEGDDDPVPQPSGEDPREVTFVADVAPIYYERCVACHQPGGAAPFSLTTYADARTYALPSRAATAARTMPPWLVTSDGSCGEFADSIALTDEQIATIGTWVDQGMLEGSGSLPTPPNPPNVPDTVEYATPHFVPEIAGGDLAQFDEYRCFLIDPNLPGDRYVTGFELEPGNPALVHHVVVFNLDPNADVGDGKTNLDVIHDLAAESPDREGWPCFGAAGEGTEFSGAPITWAPGQGPLAYPPGTGAKVAADELLVAQVHYNLSDTSLLGQSDSTRLAIRWADQVDKEGFFVFPDPLLESLFESEPDLLPPGQPSYQYTWQATPAELGLAGIGAVDIYGIFPHMHELGRKFSLSVLRDGEGPSCAADVQNWDFNWQRMYFYQQPIRVFEDEPLQVVCDYDTTSRTDDVYPGWGTRNEMCLALMFLVPAE